MDKKMLIVHENGRILKTYKVWMKNPTAMIKIKKEKFKSYRGTKDKIVAFMCVEAAIKYYKKFDPQKHDLVWVCGHHKVGKRI